MTEPTKTKASTKAPKPAVSMAAPEPDFVVKDLQSSADDAIKLAYGSMTLPPAQFLGLFSKVGEEYMGFVAKRMQAQVERVQSLRGCATLEDVAKAEMAFFGKAAEDYAQQFEKVSEATHQVASGIATKP